VGAGTAVMRRGEGRPPGRAGRGARTPAFHGTRALADLDPAAPSLLFPARGRLVRGARRRDRRTSATRAPGSPVRRSF